MAMSRRTRGTSVRHPRLPAAYEEFKPVIEREQDQSSHFILIYLPGFLKDQISLVAENTSRIIRVHGERFVPVTGNNRIRFRETITVPEDCQVSDTHVNFESGILRITLPKLIIAEPVVAEDHSAQSSPNPPHSSPARSSSPIPPTSEQPQTQPRLQPLVDELSTPEKQSTSVPPPPNKLPTEEYLETSTEFPQPVEEGERAGDEGKGEDKSRDHHLEGKELGKATMIKNYGLKLNEDNQQQLLVNAGVAAIVILSLGAYISYTFGEWEISLP